MLKRLIATTVPIVLLAVSAHASDPVYSDMLGDYSYEGTLYEIDSPTSIKLWADKEEKTFLQVHFHDLNAEFDSCDGNEMTQRNIAACDFIENALEDQIVQVYTVRYDTLKQEMVAQVMVNGVIINNELVRQGLMMKDPSTRNLPLIRAEKEARCMRRGYWEVMKGNVYEDLRCQ